MAIFVRYKEKICLRMVLFFVLIISWFIGNRMEQDEVTYAQETLGMYSASYALMDGDTGRILNGKAQSSPMANASTTKILTAIVTLENCELNEMVLVSSNAENQPKVRYGIKAGEEYALKELMYGLMLESYNDCAVAIAEHVAGSVEAFAKMLNEKAKEIGCNDTYFITPNGLDAENEEGFHHSTAEDLCRIMAYCVWKSPKKDVFLEITQTRSYGDFVNRNSFLDQMEGVLSGKTGYTAKAGYCYVAALEENGERYTIALLACGWPNNKTYKWEDAKTLFTYGLENYDKKKVKVEEEIVCVELEGCVDKPSFSMLNKKGILQLKSEDRSYEILLTDKEQLRKEKNIKNSVRLPMKEGEVLGQYVLYVEEQKVDTIPFIAMESVDYWDLNKVLWVIFCQFFSVDS